MRKAKEDILIEGLNSKNDDLAIEVIRNIRRSVFLETVNTENISNINYALSTKESEVINKIDSDFLVIDNFIEGLIKIICDIKGYDLTMFTVINESKSRFIKTDLSKYTKLINVITTKMIDVAGYTQNKLSDAEQSAFIDKIYELMIMINTYHNLIRTIFREVNIQLKKVKKIRIFQLRQHFSLLAKKN